MFPVLVSPKCSDSVSCPSSSLAVGQFNSPSSRPFISFSGLHTRSTHAVQHPHPCFQEGRLRRVSSPERQCEGRCDVDIDRLTVFFKDDAIVQQVVVEAGRRRVPQHRPLHNAWDSMSQFNASKFLFPESPERIQNSTRDVPALVCIPIRLLPSPSTFSGI